MLRACENVSLKRSTRKSKLRASPAAFVGVVAASDEGKVRQRAIKEFTIKPRVQERLPGVRRRFDKDIVRGTIQTLIEAAPKYSSSILTLMRRIGDYPNQQKGKNSRYFIDNGRKIRYKIQRISLIGTPSRGHS